MIALALIWVKLACLYGAWHVFSRAAAGPIISAIDHVESLIRESL